MAGSLLTVATQMICPHGGKVVAVPKNAKAKAAGAFILLQSDTFTVVGCPFTLPGPKPSPCVMVRWLVADQKTKIGQTDATLSVSSVGICFSDAQLPQGPVVITTVQPSVTTM